MRPAGRLRVTPVSSSTVDLSIDVHSIARIRRESQAPCAAFLIGTLSQGPRGSAQQERNRAARA